MCSKGRSLRQLSRWVATSLPGSGRRLSAGPTSPSSQGAQIRRSRSTSRSRRSRVDTRVSPALWALLWRQEPGTLMAPS